MAHKVDEWLSQLGLGAYAQAFTENDIEFEVLSELSDDDLSQLGMSLGHRRKFLKAVTELTGSVNRAAQKALNETSQALPIHGDVERRQLTVMFCDLVGSTEISTRLDPEDLRELMRRYQDTVAGVVARFEGHVAKFLGDGVLAFFGWPRAYEDQAERAIRSGLAAVEAVANLKINDGQVLRARVGIATGQVVIGDIVGDVAMEADAIAGTTPNLAARLESVAAPEQVVIGEDTRRLVGQQFSLDNLGEQELKGFGQPVPAWLVKGEARAESRFAASRRHSLARFVGRQSELSILCDRWELAKAGEGQVVLLSGQAGIGKSRVTQKMSELIGADKHFRPQYQCSPHHLNSPLYPAIKQLEFAANLALDDSTETKLSKLEGLLEQSATKDVVPLMAELLAIPADDGYSPLALTPQEKKQKTLQAFVRTFEGLSAQYPVFFVLEDAHWIDPTTRELMDLLIDLAAALPALILITHRPEFETTWSSYAHCTVLTLNRLSREACTDLVSDVTGGMTLPQEVLDQIVSKTDGVPLFVEELTKTVLESGLVVQAGDQYELGRPLPPLAIPSTLRDLLMARLDRLGTHKEIAQIGAAIGREFPLSLLEQITPLSGSELEKVLDLLIRSEIVFRRGTGREASYIFKHALIQDAAYDSLLKVRRKEIHARIADALLSRFAGRVQNEPEVLANHFTQAGLLQKAAPYWLLAGQRAIARSANSEAIAHLTEGLDVVAQISDATGVSSLELDIQISLGSARIASRGYSAEETEQAWLRARQLLAGVGEDARQFAILNGLCLVYWNRAQLKRMQETCEDMLRRAARQNDTLPQLVAHRITSVGLNAMGKFEQAYEHSKRAAELYHPKHHRETAHQFGHDQGVGTYWNLAVALLFLGYPDSSVDAGVRASRLAVELQNANTNSYNSLYHAFTKLVRRDWEGARNIAEPMIVEASARSMALWVAFGHHLLGCALVNLDEPEVALEKLRIGQDQAEMLSNNVFRSMTLNFEAQALSLLGSHQEAIARLDDALRIVEATDERWWQPEIHRIRGEIIQRMNGVTDEAEASFRNAMAIATDQKARLVELRTATSLGRLLRDQGKRADAHDILAPRYAWFTEGFDTPDLIDAKILLDELA